MSRFATGFACTLVAVLCISSIAAADDGRWDNRVDLTTTTGLIGYRPGKIVADDSKETFVAAENQTARTEVRGRLRIIGSWLEFDLEPYTVIPAEQVRVNVGGVEISLFANVTSWARIGLYHHSAHNFSDSTYGWGIDLNAFALDVRLVDGKTTLFGEEGRYLLRFLGHGYYRGRASPYVFTPATRVEASAIGETAWRGALLFDGVHPAGRTECALAVAGDGAPTSATANCALAFRVGPRFFGALGEHLYAGPFLSYGANFSRRAEFGRDAFAGGIRIDLVFADSTSKPRDR